LLLKNLRTCSGSIGGVFAVTGHIAADCDPHTSPLSMTKDRLYGSADPRAGLADYSAKIVHPLSFQVCFTA
jgi:hypothetical protein